MKYRLYKKNKVDKIEKYKEKVQKHYNNNGHPNIICLPVRTYDDKIAVPLVIDGCPDNDGDDGLVDSIEPEVKDGPT